MRINLSSQSQNPSLVETEELLKRHEQDQPHSQSQVQPKADWLVFGAHPDDVEIGMGATIARFAAAGKRIVLVDLTYAEFSSNGDVQSRQQEAEQASNLLGVYQRINLGLPDRGLRVVPEQVNALARVIRMWQPEVVFGPVMTDRHPDHVRTSQLVQEALMNARLRKVMPDLSAWTVTRYWQYHIHQWERPQWFVDTTDWFELKTNALRCYRSQFESVTGVEGEDRVTTPINQGFLEQIQARDRLWGASVRGTYAEAFTTPELQVIDTF